MPSGHANDGWRINYRCRHCDQKWNASRHSSTQRAQLCVDCYINRDDIDMYIDYLEDVAEYIDGLAQ